MAHKDERFNFKRTEDVQISGYHDKYALSSKVFFEPKASAYGGINSTEYISMLNDITADDITTTSTTSLEFVIKKRVAPVYNVGQQNGLKIEIKNEGTGGGANDID